jgi:hypothetical protein
VTALPDWHPLARRLHSGAPPVPVWVRWAEGEVPTGRFYADLDDLPLEAATV